MITLGERSMKYKHIFLGILFLATISGMAFSQQGQMRMGEMPRMDLAKRLNLTDAQKEQIGKLRTEFQKQQIAQRSKLQLSRIELHELMRADNPDKSAIEKKIQESSQMQAQQRIARMNHLLAVRNLLTPEQQKIAREGIRERFRDGFRQNGFHMRGNRGGMFRGQGMRGRMHQRDGFGGGPWFDQEFDDELPENPEE
jgi:Spy/CpxP family protein refolding chaperone